MGRGVVLGLLVSLYLVNYVHGQLISGNVLQTLQRTTGFSKFTQLVVRAKLTRLYEAPTSMTLFAFNDTAYNSLSFKDRSVIDSYTEKDLADYIKFCTIPGYRVLTSSIQDNQYVRSSDANGDRLFFNRIQRSGSNPSGRFGPVRFYVNGIEISEGTNRDIAATNGVVHGLNGVMRKTNKKTAYVWIQDPGNSTHRFQKFTELMSYLYVLDTINDLSSPDKITTFFVPNDNAMLKIPVQQLNKLRNDPVELQKIMQAHIIPNRVMFTNCVSNNEGTYNSRGQPVTFHKPLGNNGTVYVRSDEVSAAIIEGNITVSNGVVHVVDQLLGFVYNTIRDQIQQEGTKFEQLINLGTQTVQHSLVQPSGVTVFVPLDTAFQKIVNIPWVNLYSNQTLVDMVLRLHILERNNQIMMTSLSPMGGYNYRQYRQTTYSNKTIAVFKERGETWVQGGNVKARVIRPDIKTVNGMVHIIDSVLGIPYLDLPMLICHDVWLLRTYDYMRRVGLKNHLTDRRFTAEKCSFEIYGYPPNYGSAVTSNQGTTCPTYCAQAQYQNQYPCNSGACQTNSAQCPAYCSQQQYQNQSPCNTAQCTHSTNGGGTTSCPTCTPKDTPGSRISSAFDLGYCGNTTVACDFTVFVPNSSAIDYFSVSLHGHKVMKDTPRFQWLFKRLITPGRIYLEKVENGNHQMRMMNGELVSLTKTNARDVRISFGGASANVIHMDEGATNGVIHIIDQLLFVYEDLTRDVSSAGLIPFG